MDEFDRVPVPPSRLRPAADFAASYAGEHVAGTEFVIGAMFVAWGVGTAEVIWGLAIGNTLAVLTWALVCAPVATRTRLTLYAFLEKIAGPGFLRIYSVVNGVLFCVLAGAMITVSASAVRILFGIPPQVAWYPTSPGFVLVALLVGAVVTFAAARGFRFVARFAEISAPWMITMFFVGAIAVIPVLVNGTPSIDALRSPADLFRLSEASIWQDSGGPLGTAHVAAIAWGANLAFHGGFGDMTILRYARRTSYGWFSALGMFIGHFAAWLAAGMMGAGAAMLLSTPLTQLDAGEVAFQALGPIGILAVIIAGWTTSNPTIYRAGLAFQSLHPSWSRQRVTIIVGVVTTAVACFPFVFTRLLDFLGLMALTLAPVGGLIFAEHYLLERLGLPRYWSSIRGQVANPAALLSWALGVGTAAWLGLVEGIHVLFLFVPAWFVGMLTYPPLAALFGASKADRVAARRAEEAEAERRAAEKAALEGGLGKEGSSTRLVRTALIVVAASALLASLALAGFAARSGDLDAYRQALPVATAAYFAAALLVAVLSGRQRDA